MITCDETVLLAAHMIPNSSPRKAHESTEKGSRCKGSLLNRLAKDDYGYYIPVGEHLLSEIGHSVDEDVYKIRRQFAKFTYYPSVKSRDWRINAAVWRVWDFRS